MEFHTVEYLLCNAPLLALFQGETSQISGRVVTGLPVNQSGIALPDPNLTDVANWTASCVITGHLVSALHGMSDFWSRYHSPFMDTADQASLSAISVA